MRVKLTVAAIAVICLAIAAWWWHRGGEDHASTSPAATASRDTSGRPRGDRRGGEEPAPLPPLVDDDPRGELRLEGQVVDADDHPVAGAIVVLGSNPPRSATTEADGGFRSTAWSAGRTHCSRARGRASVGR